MDEILAGSQEAPVRHRCVARDLRHPTLIGMWGYASEMDRATGEMDEKQHIVGYQSPERPYLGGEEVGGDQYVHVGANKCLPRGCFLALRSGRNPMAFQDIPHRLITDGVAQMR